MERTSWISLREVTDLPFDDESVMGRLVRAMGPFGFIAVDQDRVCLDDLCAPEKPGKIVRCIGDPRECITLYMTSDSETLGCVAGWISEER